jgi:5'-3' exonuclease
MGIPFYFASLIRSHPGITSVVKQRMDVDVMGIDFNCLIHRYLKDDSPIQSVLDALDHIISNTCNAKQIFIAFDGLVPYAKIVQQRYRRFRVKDQSGTFDRNQISPDTPFMRELEQGIRGRFPLITISPTQEPGEGEHKLFNQIRKLPEQHRRTVCVYGLDADLILLSLFNHSISKPQSLWLLRESSEFNDPRLKHAEFSTLSIWKVLDALPMDIEQYLAMCVLCFGNDFMPNLALFSLREDGYARAMEVYEQSGKPNLFTPIGRYRFLEHAAKNETKTLSEIIRRRKRPEERAVLGRDTHSFSKKYSIHVLDGVRDLNPVVESFWKTYNWTMHYFRTNDVLDWDWVYPYPDAPLIQDILKTYQNEKPARKELSYKISDQLAFILPSTSLRKAKRRVLYKDEIYQETRDPWIKRYDWETKPRISLPWNPTYELTSVSPL